MADAEFGMDIESRDISQMFHSCSSLFWNIPKLSSKRNLDQDIYNYNFGMTEITQI
jgi:hypothetical protein